MSIIPGLGMVPAFLGGASEPPSYVGTGAQADGWSGPTSPGLPSGWQPGDLHLLFVALRATSDLRISTPSGWTSQHSQVLVALSGDYCSLQIFSRIAQSGDAAPISLIAAGVAYVVGYRGVDASSPVEAAAGAQTQTGASSYAYQNITTLGANRRVVAAFVAFRSTTAATTGTPDASFTERADGSSINPSVSISLQIEDKVLEAAGSVGSLTHTFSATTNGHLRAALAVLPV